eukprot:SAG25_NODE_11427_length_304_cov_1.517073_1_plen_86_part_10
MSAPFPSWNRSILTEIYLCHACSYHEIEDGNGAPGPSDGSADERFQPISAEDIHGDRSQSQRESALAAFRAGTCRVLVATDVAARG